MIEMTSGTYASRVAARLAAPAATPPQGRGVPTTGTAKAFGPLWRLRGVNATSTEYDSLAGGLPV